MKKGQVKAGATGPAGAAGAKGAKGVGGPAGDFGPQGEKGPQGDTGVTGQARVVASVTSQSAVLSGSRGLTPRTSRRAAPVSTPFRQPASPEQHLQERAGVRQDHYQTATGAAGSEHLVRTSQDHGFYVAIN